MVATSQRKWFTMKEKSDAEMQESEGEAVPMVAMVPRLSLLSSMPVPLDILVSFQ